MAGPGARDEGASTNTFRQAAEAAVRSAQDHMGQQERCGHVANLTIVHFLECAPQKSASGVDAGCVAVSSNSGPVC